MLLKITTPSWAKPVDFRCRFVKPCQPPAVYSCSSQENRPATIPSI